MSERISVITICFNNLEELRATMESVDSQQTLPHEHWIIDGSTTPVIREYLESHEQPSYRKWISERDKGIADAFNKGIIRATGDIVNMLNSGDRYAGPLTLSTVTTAFRQNPQISWLHSKITTERGSVHVILGKPFDKYKLYRGMRSVWHQSMFLKKTIHDKYGLYDTSIRIAMDYDFLCRMAEEPFLFIETPLIAFAAGGVSQANYLQSLEQMKEIYKKHFGNDLRLQVWQMRLKLLYYLLTSPVGKTLYRIKVLLRLENM